VHVYHKNFSGLRAENQKLQEELDEANRKLKLVCAYPRVSVWHDDSLATFELTLTALLSLWCGAGAARK
jgi:hypothetical protein